MDGREPLAGELLDHLFACERILLLDRIDELIIQVEGARQVPLSGNVMFDRDQMLAMLYELRDQLPEELRDDNPRGIIRVVNGARC